MMPPRRLVLAAYVAGSNSRRFIDEPMGEGRGRTAKASPATSTSMDNLKTDAEHFMTNI
jgi:hypothetical protein